VATKGTAPTAYNNYDPATKRLLGSGYRYDANGNLTAMPGLSNLNGTNSYGCDPAGHRVWKQGPDGVTHVYYNGLDGKPLADFSLNPQTQQVQGGSPMLYFAGRRVDNAAVEDRLGTAVVENGQQRMGFFPYGSERSGTASQVQYATYTRDATTTLDYAQQRYYSSQVSRFTTPDPKPSSANPQIPQSWNRYSYALGDPVNKTDPSGADPEFEDGEEMSSFGGMSSSGGVSSYGGMFGDGGPGTVGNPYDIGYTLSISTAVAGNPDPSLPYPPWAVWVMAQALSKPLTLSAVPPIGGNGSSTLTTEGAIRAAEAGARADLAKKDCFHLLGFTSANDAQAWFDNHITFHEGAYGDLQVSNGAPVSSSGAVNAPAWTYGFGQVNINTNYSWNNFSSVPTSTGGTFNYLGYINKAMGTTMSSGQLGTLIVVHELEHNRPAGAQETNQDKSDIYNDCIK